MLEDRYKILTSELEKKVWTSEEDTMLDVLVSMYGKKWNFLSKHFVNRTPAMIRGRYSRRTINPSRTNYQYRCKRCKQFKKGHSCLQPSNKSVSDATLLLSVGG